MRELVKLENVKKSFSKKTVFGKSTSLVTAVDDVSLTIYQGETLGLVGESGSGKTTLGRSILQLETIDSGKIYFDNQLLTGLSKKKRQPFQQRMQIIFQDPYSSLNPHMTALEQVMEPLKLLMNLSCAEKKAKDMLLKVGFTNGMCYKYPKEFSGGQRQRIGIARAIAVNPEFVLCDEPISALDVSIQAQIINLLLDLQKERCLTYLFVSHDLSMIRYVSDRIAVMYLGNLVELAYTEQLFNNPQHDYTKYLLNAIPIADPSNVRQKNQSEIYFNDKQVNLTLNSIWTEIEPSHFVLLSPKTE